MPTDFWRSNVSEPHAARTKAILAAHPHVRGLIGRNPWTAAIALFVVSFQVALAAAVGRLGAAWWPLALVLAWFVGAFANHCLFVIVHDSVHDLIFKKRSWNKAIALFADMPNIVPSAVAFRTYHLKHHSGLGKQSADAAIPSKWEARLVGDSSIAKAIWLALTPIVQASRALRVRGLALRDPWSLTNFAANLLFAVGVAELLGGVGLIYLVASFWFSIGLHPLGARWIQEHFTLDPEQETASYYGPLNFVALNVGYHNEHHDFPSVPWSRLPRLRRSAPEIYGALRSCSSWSALLWQFLSDKRYSLLSVVTRD